MIVVSTLLFLAFVLAMRKRRLRDREKNDSNGYRQKQTIKMSVMVRICALEYSEEGVDVDEGEKEVNGVKECI